MAAEPQVAPEQAAGAEAGEKTPLLSAKGFAFVGALLVAEAVVMLGIYIMASGSGARAEGKKGKFEEIKIPKFETTIKLIGTQTRFVTIEFALVVDPDNLKGINAELTRLDSRIKEQVLDKIYTLRFAQMQLLDTRLDFKKHMKKVYNEILKGYGPGNLGEEPVKEVLIRGWKY